MPAASLLSTIDHKGRLVMAGDEIRILDVTPDPDMDEDDLDMFMGMVGSTCAIDAIDHDGLAWVTVWWNTGEGSMTTTVGLDSSQFTRTD